MRQWSSVQGDTYPLTTAAASPTLATPGPSRPRPLGRSGRWSGGGRRSGSGAPGMRDWPPKAVIAACATGPWPLLPTKESGPRADCSPRSLSRRPLHRMGPTRAAFQKMRLADQVAACDDRWVAWDRAPGQSCHPVGVMSRTPRASTITDHPIRWRQGFALLILAWLWWARLRSISPMGFTTPRTRSRRRSPRAR